jgi:arginyl-tRNA synthetase
MKHDIELAVASAVKELFDVDLDPELTRPDEQFGDYTTNVALRLSKQVGDNPRVIADALSATLMERLGANAHRSDGCRARVL